MDHRDATAITKAMTQGGVVIPQVKSAQDLWVDEQMRLMAAMPEPLLDKSSGRHPTKRPGSKRVRDKLRKNAKKL